MATWNREPLFHISSPLEGWKGPKPSRHHDFINVRDFPQCWYDLDVTVEVEAKAKEVAIQRLRTVPGEEGQDGEVAGSSADSPQLHCGHVAATRED